jgi:hypothetical protein
MSKKTPRSKRPSLRQHSAKDLAPAIGGHRVSQPVFATAAERLRRIRHQLTLLEGLVELIATESVSSIAVIASKKQLDDAARRALMNVSEQVWWMERREKALAGVDCPTDDDLDERSIDGDVARETRRGSLSTLTRPGASI